MSDEIVTSCTGSKEHPFFVERLPGAGESGIVKLGDGWYFCKPLPGGRRWHVRSFRTNEKRPAKTYEVAVADGTSARHSCTCGDFINRSRGGQLPCKHIRACALIIVALESQP